MQPGASFPVIDVTNQVRGRQYLWESNISWTSHENSCILCNPTFHYVFQKSRPLVHILIQINPIFELTALLVRFDVKPLQIFMYFTVPPVKN